MATKVGVENSMQQQTESMGKVDTAKEVPPSRSVKMAKGRTQPNDETLDENAKVPPTQSGKMATIGSVENIVQKRRLNAQVFEQRLKAKMIESISSESLRKKRKKREVAVGKTAEPKRKVIVTNILNLMEV